MTTTISKKTNLYKQDALRNLAERYYSGDEDFDTIKKRNITELYKKQRKVYVKIKKKMSFNANGETSDGKSTLMAHEVAEVNEELGRPMKADYILGNQQEYANWIRANPNETNLMVQIDEHSDMAETGENATTEISWLREVSNIHAQTYIHTATCSPRDQPDRNAFLHFQIASMGEGWTQAYVYYNLLIAGASHLQIIGHVNIDVRKTLQQPWYKKYREMKFKRIDLLRKEGVAHERDLYYAPIILEVVSELHPYTSFGKCTEAMVEGMVDTKAREHKMPLSIIGVSKLTKKCKVILDLYKDYEKLRKEQAQLKHKIARLKDHTADDDHRILGIDAALKTINNLIEKKLEEQRHLQALYKQYKEII